MVFCILNKASEWASNKLTDLNSKSLNKEKHINDVDSFFAMGCISVIPNKVYIRNEVHFSWSLIFDLFQSLANIYPNE